MEEKNLVQLVAGNQTTITMFIQEIKHNNNIATATYPQFQNKSLLHFAVAHKNNQALVEEILKYNSDIDAQDINGLTALHIAAKNGNLNMIKLLIDAGAEHTLKTGLDRDIYTLLSLHDHKELIDKVEAYAAGKSKPILIVTEQEKTISSDYITHHAVHRAPASPSQTRNTEPKQSSKTSFGRYLLKGIINVKDKLASIKPQKPPEEPSLITPSQPSSPTTTTSRKKQ